MKPNREWVLMYRPDPSVSELHSAIIDKMKSGSFKMSLPSKGLLFPNQSAVGMVVSFQMKLHQLQIRYAWKYNSAGYYRA
ncbi:MAG: hypothetical protein ABI707_16655 [Ferruginibacter sp.]